MKTMGKIAVVASFVIILALIVIVLAFNNQKTTGLAIDNGITGNAVQDSFVSDSPHYTHMPLTYNISQDCGNYEGKRIEDAFSAIENESSRVVDFSKIDGRADITAVCHKNSSVSNGYMEAGDGTYVYTGKSNIIYGIVNFYNVIPDSNNYPGGCISYPDIEIHEILHAFGFGHVTDRKSIMSPVSNGCRVRNIDSEIIDKLREIYS